MNDMNYNNGYAVPVACGNGFGGCGDAGWLIILLICLFGGFNNGNGFGGWGNNGNLATATETAALVQQDNTRAQVAEIASRQQLNQQFTAGIADGVNRIQDAQLGLRTDLCQLGNNLTGQINQNRFDSQQQVCELKQAIIDNRLAIESKLSDYRMEDLKEKNCALQSQLERQQLACSQDAQTNAIVNAINARPCPPPPPAWPAPVGAPAYACGAYGSCNPCGPSNYELESLAALRSIANGVQATNTALAQQTTTLGNLTTTLAAVEARVNQISTT